MPLYTYECPNHGDFDILLSIKGMVKKIPCPDCNTISKQVIVNGGGGFFSTESNWPKEVGKTLEEPSIETVQDLKKFYENNPNIKPKESHPSIPSTIGDIKRPACEKEAKRTRHDRAMQALQKHNRIEIYN